MSKKQRNRRKEKPRQSAAAPQPSSPRKWALLVVIALAGVLLGFGVRKFTQPQPQPQVAASDVASTVVADDAEEKSEVPANSSAQQTVFDSILGKWARADGGYILDLRGVDDTGKLDAAYLNPRPIHVARAEATRPGAEIKVFIELQDVNYPGSTYDLTYDITSDQLTGVYFQAVQQQSFEVRFSRADEAR